MSTAVVRDAYRSQQVAAAYDAERFSAWAGRLFNRLEQRALRALLGRALGHDRSPRVLDVPCGTGRITRLLLAMGFDVLGADISPAMIGVAAAACGPYTRYAEFRQLDLDALQLPDDSFPLVTCIRLLHHLDSPSRAAVLKELARVSSRHVLINLPFASPYYRLRRRVKRLLGQGVSRQCATRAQILHEAAAAGLRPVLRRFVLPWASEDLLLLLEKSA